MTTVNENKSNTDGSDKTQQNQACSNNGQHEGEFNDKEQDVEIQENINEDDFIEGLDVVDTWDDEEKDKPRRRSWDRSRGRDRRNSRYQNQSGYTIITVLISNNSMKNYSLKPIPIHYILEQIHCIELLVIWNSINEFVLIDHFSREKL